MGREDIKTKELVRRKKGDANLPTLARTRVEGKPTKWTIATVPPKLAINEHQYLRGWGINGIAVRCQGNGTAMVNLCF